ncbi:hypothetical protein PanWU01x14_259210 [Parasponia andersonii]|uniref:Uncharacterized protein n=1 Tax=Parasponia andersonii TaxID=3476 RepID=A0A2P5B9I5_PARAD|nr:hypothetical protein PanWU01x14_259210 [Parasponia andersonii]
MSEKVYPHAANASARGQKIFKRSTRASLFLRGVWKKLGDPKILFRLDGIRPGFNLNKKGRLLWKAIGHYGWKEIEGSFGGVEDCVDSMWDRIGLWVAIWLHDVKDFVSFSLSDMVRDWSPPVM